MNIGDIIKMLPNLTYMECGSCKNYFFIHEQADIPMSLNEPKYCPYCGIEFEDEIEV